MSSQRGFTQQGGQRKRQKVTGVVIGVATLAAFASLLVSGRVRYPAPYHHRLGKSFTAVVWDVGQDGRLKLVPLANRGEQFTCSVYGVVVPSGKLARDVLKRTVLHQGVIVTVCDTDAQEKEMYGIARERDGVDLGLELVRSGAGYAALPRYRAAESEASREGLGLWRRGRADRNRTEE